MAELVSEVPVAEGFEDNVVMGDAQQGDENSRHRFEESGGAVDTDSRGGYQGESQNQSQSQGMDAKRNRDEGDIAEEPEEKEDVQGLSFPSARVQRIMRKHPDKKKKFMKEAVHAVAVATEYFLQNLCKTAYSVTTEKKRKTMSLTDISHCIKTIDRFEFLDGPGILPEPSEKPKKARAPAAAAQAAVPPQVPNAFRAVQAMQGAMPAQADAPGVLAAPSSA